MVRARKPSPQTVLVLKALAAQPSAWRHGYDLSRETGLSSGTLYPLLVRLKDAGLLDAEWQPAAQPGRPARHAYRLAAEGLSLARQVGAAGASPLPPRLVGAPA